MRWTPAHPSDTDGMLVRLKALNRPTPRMLDDITGRLRAITGAQEKAIRHLRSINRKLTAFGVAATATDVEVPPVPEPPPSPSPGGPPEPLDC